MYRMMPLILLGFALRAAAHPPLILPEGIYEPMAAKVMAGLVMSESLRHWAEGVLAAHPHPFASKVRGTLGVFHNTTLYGNAWKRLFEGPFGEPAIRASLRSTGAVRLLIVRGKDLADFVEALRADEGSPDENGRLSLTGPFKPNRSGNVLVLEKGRWENPRPFRLYAVALDSYATILSKELEILKNEIVWELADPPTALEVIPPNFTRPSDCRRLIIRNLH